MIRVGPVGVLVEEIQPAMRAAEAGQRYDARRRRPILARQRRRPGGVSRGRKLLVAGNASVSTSGNRWRGQRMSSDSTATTPERCPVLAKQCQRGLEAGVEADADVTDRVAIRVACRDPRVDDPRNL